MIGVCIGVAAASIADASELYARCDDVEYVEQADWPDFIAEAARDAAQSHIRVAGLNFLAVGSVCDFNAEKGLTLTFQWEYLDFSDVAWRFDIRSRFGSGELFLIKHDGEPLYFDVPKNVDAVVVMDMPDGSFVHIVGKGSMMASPDGTVSAVIDGLELHAGSWPGDLDDGISVHLKPNAAHFGASRVRLEGNSIFLNGVIGLQTYQQLHEIAAQSATPKTVIFEKVDGTYSHIATAFTGRLIREAGWNTYATQDSEIFSGGVDLFLSGVTRVVEEGADLGVHPGCCYAGREAGELPEDHPYHRQLVEYSNEMLGEPDGAQFHHFTDRVVPFDKFRLLSNEDLLYWRVATEIVEPRDAAQ